MSRQIGFRRGEDIRGLRPKLNEVSRQAARARSRGESPATPAGGVVNCAVTDVITVSGTIDFVPATGPTSTANVNRMTYFTAILPPELFGSEVRLKMGPFPDITPT